MKVRFNVPVAVLIIGSSPDALSFTTKFQHRGFFVEASADGDPTLHSDQVPAEYQHFRMMRELVFLVTPGEEKEGTRIAELSGTNRDGHSW